VKLELRQTCGQCPEQYDVYLDGNEVGYIRHRGGITEAHCPFMEVVFFTTEAEGRGDFEDNERDGILTKCCAAILNALGHEGHDTDNYWISTNG
jgi:hypothetical protein